MDTAAFLYFKDIAMRSEELIKTLLIAAKNETNIVKQMLFSMAAERLQELTE